MSDFVYLIDSNILSRLSREQRSHRFVERHCRVLTEVFDEVRKARTVSRMRAIEYEMSAEVLVTVREVMQSLVPQDFALVDLYQNHGAADPLLVAVALRENRRSSEMLFAPEWAIATSDVAVAETAARFGISVVDEQRFKQLLSNA